MATFAGTAANIKAIPGTTPGTVRTPIIGDIWLGIAEPIFSFNLITASLTKSGVQLISDVPLTGTSYNVITVVSPGNAVIGDVNKAQGVSVSADGTAVVGQQTQPTQFTATGYTATIFYRPVAIAPTTWQLQYCTYNVTAGVIAFGPMQVLDLPQTPTGASSVQWRITDTPLGFLAVAAYIQSGVAQFLSSYVIGGVAQPPLLQTFVVNGYPYQSYIQASTQYISTKSLPDLWVGTANYTSGSTSATAQVLYTSANVELDLLGSYSPDGYTPNSFLPRGVYNNGKTLMIDGAVLPTGSTQQQYYCLAQATASGWAVLYYGPEIFLSFPTQSLGHNLSGQDFFLSSTVNADPNNEFSPLVTTYYDIALTTKPVALRMGQRNDGLGIFKHPRLQASTNAGTSRQSTRSIRVGGKEMYF